MNTTTTEQAAAPEPTLIYYATLVQGQTYRIRGVVFEFKEEKAVSKALWEYLKKEAFKSVKQGDDDDVRRVNVAMFEYRTAVAGQDDLPAEPASVISGAPKRTRAAAAAPLAKAAQPAPVVPATQDDPFPETKTA